jgi:hypothetical protein
MPMEPDVWNNGKRTPHNEFMQGSGELGDESTVGDRGPTPTQGPPPHGVGQRGPTPTQGPPPHGVGQPTPPAPTPSVRGPPKAPPPHVNDISVGQPMVPTPQSDAQLWAQTAAPPRPQSAGPAWVSNNAPQFVTASQLHHTDMLQKILTDNADVFYIIEKVSTALTALADNSEGLPANMQELKTKVETIHCNMEVLKSGMNEWKHEVAEMNRNIEFLMREMHDLKSNNEYMKNQLWDMCKNKFREQMVELTDKFMEHIKDREQQMHIDRQMPTDVNIMQAPPDEDIADDGPPPTELTAASSSLDELSTAVNVNSIPNTDISSSSAASSTTSDKDDADKGTNFLLV